MKLSIVQQLNLRDLLLKAIGEPEAFVMLADLHKSGLPFDGFAESEQLINAIRLYSKHYPDDILDRLIDAGMPLRSSAPGVNSSLADILVAGVSNMPLDKKTALFDRLLELGDPFMHAPHFDGNRLHRIIGSEKMLYSESEIQSMLSPILESKVLTQVDKVELLSGADEGLNTPLERLIKMEFFTPRFGIESIVNRLILAGSPLPDLNRLSNEIANSIKLDETKMKSFESLIVNLSAERLSILMADTGVDEPVRMRPRI